MMKKIVLFCLFCSFANSYASSAAITGFAADAELNTSLANMVERATLDAQQNPWEENRAPVVKFGEFSFQLDQVTKEGPYTIINKYKRIQVGPRSVRGLRWWDSAYFEVRHYTHLAPEAQKISLADLVTFPHKGEGYQVAYTDYSSSFKKGNQENALVAQLIISNENYYRAKGWCPAGYIKIARVVRTPKSITIYEFRYTRKTECDFGIEGVEPYVLTRTYGITSLKPKEKEWKDIMGALTLPKVLTEYNYVNGL